MRNDLTVLDCTLRDGGYINDWKWKKPIAEDIIRTLSRSGIDVIEIGFLREIEQYDRDRTVSDKIEDLNSLISERADNDNTIYAAMAMCSNYNPDNLIDYPGRGIELIRVTAHDYDIKEGIEFAARIQKKGYKVSINPINIMGYSDDQIMDIVRRVNEIMPYQFSIVDTFGSMKRRDLDRIVSLVDHNLNKTIRLGLHLHENMSLSFSLAQIFVDKHLDRPISIDASLYGMGRTPGNLPIELISDYLNEYYNKAYDIDYMMDAILDYIMPLKGESNWGYSPSYFLSAKYNLHRNYAEFYLNKGDLTYRDINHILMRFDADRSSRYDVVYAEEMYDRYKNDVTDDHDSVEKLKQELASKNILLIAPGSSIISELAAVKEYIEQEQPVIISINFEPTEYKVDFSFFSNSKRYERYKGTKTHRIITSNIKDANEDYIISYDRIDVETCHNSLVMLIYLLQQIGITDVAVAGADGYKPGQSNYFNEIYDIDAKKRRSDQNEAIRKEIERSGMKVRYITPSVYGG